MDSNTLTAHRSSTPRRPCPLRGEVLRLSALTPSLEEQLFALYDAHYEGGSRARFHADLLEKQWILLLREERTGRPAGFSTQLLMDACVDGVKLRALFSGDTVIHRDFWGTQELTRTWLRFAGAEWARCDGMPFYWLLISKGHRTYQYLPLFFHAFYPRCDAPTPPFEQRLIDTLAAARYPGDFCPATGLLQWRGEHDRLRPELDASHRRLHSPHVRYFLERNPTHHLGTDLVCVAEICPGNLRGWVRAALQRAAEGA
jgi:hypothetical protein